MCDSPSRSVVDGNREVGYPVERGEGSYTHQTSPTAFTSQDYHASRDGQSIVSGYPETYPCVQAPPFHYSPSYEPGDFQDIPAQEALEAPVSNNAIHSPPPDLHLTAWTPDIQAYPPYDVQVTDPTYDRTEAVFSTRQFTPVPYPDLAASGYEGGGWFGLLPPLTNLSPDQHQTEGRSSNTTPEHNYYFYERREEIFSDPSATRQLHSVATESPPPTLTVARRLSVRRRTGTSASDPAGGAGSGATETLAGSPLVDDVGSQTPKKRKLAATPDETREVKRTRHGRSQRPIDTRGSTQVVPPAIPPTPLHLRIVEQVPYTYDVAQTGWTPLEAIDFKVKGVKGMRLTDAMNLRFDGPDERDELMFQSGGVGTSISCRIHFAGYPACNRPRQIVTTNHTRERAPITKEKLAYEVAKCIEAYLRKLEKEGTPFCVRFGDMYLTKLVNVSRASWQPEICQVDTSVSS